MNKWSRRSLNYRDVNRLIRLVMFLSLAAVLLPWGCASDDSGSGDLASNVDVAGYLTTNQFWIEGLSAEGIDLEDVNSVFWHVFSRLPDEVTVYPSENYYYFILYINGRQIWGNIRLAAGYRERGELSFAYFEFDEFPSMPKAPGFTRAQLLSEEDGLTITKVDRFTWIVGYADKDVIFHLHQIPQEPPVTDILGENEVFVERTFDESGYQFFLIFNEQKNYFLWVLNEEDGLTDIFDPVGETEDIVVGRRTRFAFWVDRANDDRKILFGVRQLSVRRNDYYDGPFDQLADNYADEVRVSDYMQKAFPGVQGRIDKYGYYTDRQQPLRVAITPYTTYYTNAELEDFMARAKAADDPYQYISRRGVPEESSPETEAEAETESTS